MIHQYKKTKITIGVFVSSKNRERVVFAIIPIYRKSLNNPTTFDSSIDSLLSR